MSWKKRKKKKESTPRERQVLKGPQRLGRCGRAKRATGSTFVSPSRRFPVWESQPFKGRLLKARYGRPAGEPSTKGGLSAGLRPGFVNAAFKSSQKDESILRPLCRRRGGPDPKLPIPLPSLLPFRVCLWSLQRQVSLLAGARRLAFPVTLDKVS